MQSVLEYLRLGLGGLFLEQRYFQEQRDTPDRLTRGFVLVVMISLLAGLAALIGQALGAAINPAAPDITRAVIATLQESDWYRETVAAQGAEARVMFAETLRRLVDLAAPSLAGGLLSFVLSPFLALLLWVIYGICAHLMARLLGGQATLGQTLGCTALASGANLLALVQVIPVALVAQLFSQSPAAGGLAQGLAIPLMSLLANYVAVREAHQLAPWPAFWATILGPLLLVLLFSCAICAFVVLALGARV